MEAGGRAAPWEELLQWHHWQMVLWFLELPAGLAPAALCALVWTNISNPKSHPDPAGMAESHQWRANTDPSSQGGFLEPDELRHLELPAPPFLPLCFTDWPLCPCAPSLGGTLNPLICATNTQQCPVSSGRALGASAEGSWADLKGGLTLLGAAGVGSATHTSPVGGRSSSACKIFPAGKTAVIQGGSL